MTANWHIWLVTQSLSSQQSLTAGGFKVPNRLTFPLVIGGWLYSWAFSVGPAGLSLFGTAVGLGLLLPAYAIGGIWAQAT